MKKRQIKLKHLFFLFLSFLLEGSILGQVERTKVKPSPAPTPKKATNNKSQVTQIEATTKDGKTVILKSDKTWDYLEAITAAKAPPRTIPCELLLKDSPVIRGLKIGMSEWNIIDIFSIDRFYVFKKTDIEGVLEASIFPPGSQYLYKIPASFAGVSRLKFKTYDGKVFYLEFIYEPMEVKFENNRQFALSISKTLNLPEEGWNYTASPADQTCKEFKVTVDSRINSISLTDLTIEREIQKSEERKKQTFRPE